MVPEVRLAAESAACESARVSARGEELREPWLRTGRLVELLGTAGCGKVLLVGEAEGLLAARLSSERGAEVTWFEEDTSHLPFEADEFDAVASQFALDRIPEPRRALLEWGRVIKVGGALALVSRNELFGGWEPEPRPRRCASFTPQRFRALLEGCGFQVLNICTLIPDLKLPRLYRGDLSFSFKFERLPWFRSRGMLLFASAAKRAERSAVGDQGRA